MKRREFIGSLIGGVLGASLGAKDKELLLARRRRVHHRVHSASSYKLARVGVSSWSFHRYFPATWEDHAMQPRETLALLDFPQMVADRYKVHNLEFVAPHFASIEDAYVMELKSRLLNTRSHLVNIPLDIEEIRTAGGLSDLNKPVRDNAVEASMKWIDIAAKLGARSVRCDPGKMDPENLAPTIESYKRLVAYARPKGIHVIVENHGIVGLTHPEALVNLFKSVNNSYFGSLPDFGNFPDEATRERGLKMLFPYASTVCHAKGKEFNAEGDETQFNFPLCVEISKQAKFRGVYSIEFEGPGDPYTGVQNVVNELVKYL